MSSSEKTPAETAAVQQFIARRDRLEHPDGTFDSAGRWYPATTETQYCCDLIRAPSRAHPYSYLVHCRTLAHVARLHGVDVARVRAAIRGLEPPAKPHRLGGDTYYKAVAVLPDGRFVSIYDGQTEYRLGVKLTQPVRTHHGGGYYVYASIHAARLAEVPRTSIAGHLPRACLRVRAEGQHTRYSCTCEDCTCGWELTGQIQSQLAHAKYAFSSLTPLEVVQPATVRVAA